MEYTLGTFEDLEGIYTIFKESFNENISICKLRENFKNKNYKFIVGKENNIVVGFILATVILDQCEIIYIAVKKSKRNHHIGRNLLAFLVENFKNQITTVFLEVRSSNFQAINLYENFAFKPIGKRKNYYENPIEDAILYKKDIEPI